MGEYPISNHERRFEILINDKSFKRTYAIDIKIPPKEILDNPHILKRKLTEAFDGLIRSLFKSGSIPEISTHVVSPYELPLAKESSF